MCYKTSDTKTVKEKEQHYKVKIAEERFRSIFDKPRYHINGFAHPNMLIIPMERKDLLAPGVWGIVPEGKTGEDIKPYYKESVKYGSGLNAQSEKLFSHYLYREASMVRRCVIPVTGFFEPHHQKNKSFPYYISSGKNELLSLAGIYNVIDTYITFSILTQKASPLFEHIHNKKKRQPLILNEDGVEEWLNPDSSMEIIKKLVQQHYPEEKLDYYTVSKDLYSTKMDTDFPNILDRINYPELQESLF